MLQPAPSLARNLGAHHIWLAHDIFRSVIEPPGPGDSFCSATLLQQCGATDLQRATLCYPMFGTTR